jgi:integrase
MAKRQHFRKDPRTGVYHMDVYVNGKRCRDTLRTKDRELAKIKSVLKLKELQSTDTPDDMESTTVHGLLAEYEKHSTGQHKAHSTLQKEKTMLKVFREFLPSEKDLPVPKFTKLMADQFFRELAKRTRKTRKGDTLITASTLFLYLRFFRMVWALAVTWKMTKVNIFKLVRKPPIIKKPVRYFTEDEQRAIIEKTRELYPWEEDLVRFYLATGMRRNEALKLEWKDVHFSDKPMDAKIMIRDAKWNKFRQVPMIPVASEILKKRESLPRPFSDMGHPDTITHHFEDVLRAAKIDDAKLHDTRKTFGTALANLNVNPYTIMAWLGQTNDRVTREHYMGLDLESASKIQYIGSRSVEKPEDAQQDGRIPQEIVAAPIPFTPDLDSKTGKHKRIRRWYRKPGK